MKRVEWDLGRDIERPLLRAQTSTLLACLARRSAASATQCDEVEAVKSSAYEVVRSASVVG